MTPADSTSLSLLGVQGLIPLLLVLGLLFALAWALRRGTLPMGRLNRLDVKIEGTVPLGERRTLVVVSIEGKRLLLGLTPATVSLVSELAPGSRFEDAMSRQTSTTKGSQL